MELLEEVLVGAGATRPRRDAVDERVVESVRRNEGRMINSPAEVGGHPKMQTGESPQDSDHDGMPDEWETKTGLDPQDADDAVGDEDADGYSNIEEYLHELAGAMNSASKRPQ